MPFVVPPVVLVFGLIRTYSGPPFLLLATNLGSDAVLVGAYVILSFPYMYRAVDTGLAAIDVRSLTEASQSLGAGWARILWRVIFPNLRTALLSGAFLTLAIVVGEYTIAQFLARTWAFGPYLSLLGRGAPFTPAVVSLISFALTWIAMALIAYLGRGSRQRVQVAGAR
jgi:putative spermidine/putrescine transport system permease protein